MTSLRRLRSVVMAGAAAWLVACSNGVPDPIIEGRLGGPLVDEGCDWTLAPSTTTTGVEFSVDRGSGSSAGAAVWPRGSDDPVWVSATIGCVDAPTMLFGGVDERADSVVVVHSDGREFVPDLLEVDDRSWSAVVGEFPPGWFAEGIFNIDIVAYGDGRELARDNLRGFTG